MNISCNRERKWAAGELGVSNKRRNNIESVEELAKKAIDLDPKESVRLAEAILYSLDKPDPEIEKSWIAESEARYDAFKRGELRAENWEKSEKGTIAERKVLCRRRESNPHVHC